MTERQLALMFRLLIFSSVLRFTDWSMFYPPGSNDEFSHRFVEHLRTVRRSLSSMNIASRLCARQSSERSRISDDDHLVVATNRLLVLLLRSNTIDDDRSVRIARLSQT